MGFPSRLGQWATFAYASSRIIHHAPHSKGGQLGGKLKSQKDGASSLLSLFHALLLHPLHGTTRKAVCHQATAKSWIYSELNHTDPSCTLQLKVFLFDYRRVFILVIYLSPIHICPIFFVIIQVLSWLETAFTLCPIILPRAGQIEIQAFSEPHASGRAPATTQHILANAILNRRRCGTQHARAQQF